jgi:peptide chain release factor 1
MQPTIRRKLDQLAERHQELEHLLASAEVLSDPKRLREFSREHAQLGPLTAALRAYDENGSALESARAMLEDPELRALAAEEVAALEAERDALDRELNVLLIPKDERDEANLFLELRAGTGGDEAAIFAGDLFRMYARYAERRGWRVEILSTSEGEHGGYKEIIARVEGRGAFSRLKFESGTHRVQRVPETEAQGRIHTSAATVAILPEVDAIDEIEINPADLRIDTFRSSGAGGQHVNKTDSAIRITHLPTNIVVQCQNDRSQHRNRAEAMAMLKSKLYELELRKRQEEKQALEDTKTDIAWGHQIRSYVLDQSRIKDLRTDVEVGNTQAVLDGDLDKFIEASLKRGV